MEFQINLLTLNKSEKNITYYIINTLTTFYSQKEEYKSLKPSLFLGADWTTWPANKDDNEKSGHFYSHPSLKRNFSYTYEESVSFHQNAQAELTFKMDNNILFENEWIKNPFVDVITIGSQITLTALGETRIFTVKKISSNFNNNNNTYTYTCQDSFSYQLSRQNNGYTIDNNSSDDDFIGAKSIDYWADKICTECHVTYSYVPLKQSLFIRNPVEGKIITATSNNTYTDIVEVLKNGYNTQLDSDYFNTIIYSVSSSSANNALVSLGEQYGMQIKVYEFFNENSDHLYSVERYFWFIPLKDGDHLSGWTYNPKSNIQSFSLSQAGDNLSTIVNVKSNTIDDELISLFPTIPPFFCKVYGSDYWKSSQYYPGFFTQLCQYYSIKKSYEWLNFNSVERYENYSLVDFGQLDLNKRVSLYNRINFNYNKVYSYIVSNGTYYYSNYDGWVLAYKKDKYSNWILYGEQDDIDSDIWNNLITYATAGKKVRENLSYSFKIGILGTVSSASSGEINIFFCRETSDEELEYAKVADLCPWLENKLIDFSYLYNSDIISKKQYEELTSLFSDDLRIVNGQLALYSNEYYTAYHKKTSTLAELISQLDSLGALAEADLIQPYQDNGKSITNYDNFKLSYSLLWQDKKQAAEKTSIVDYDKTITYYSNLYFNSQQRFLKNIYNFSYYFNSINNRYGDNTVLAKISLKVKPTELTNYWLGLKNSSLYTALTSEISIDENTQLYQLSNGIYNNVQPVTKNNYSNYKIFTEQAVGEKSLDENNTYSKDQTYWAYLWTKTEDKGDKTVVSILTGSDGVPITKKEDELDESIDTSGYTSNKTVLKLSASYDINNPQIGDLWASRNLGQIYQRDTINIYESIDNLPATIARSKDKITVESSDESSAFEFKDKDSAKTPFFDYFDHKVIMKPYLDDSTKNLRELYAKYFPVNTVYYKDDSGYQEISLVTYQNESSYYRRVQDATLKKNLTISGGLLVAAGGLLGISVGIGLLIAAQTAGYNDESIFDTSGPSKKALDMYFYTDSIIEGWSNAQWVPWFLKDENDYSDIKKLASSSEKKTYSNFYNLLGLTYSALTYANDADMTVLRVVAPITTEVWSQRSKFYYKGNWARPMKATDCCNSSDEYYIVPLQSYYDRSSNWSTKGEKVNNLNSETTVENINDYLSSITEDDLINTIIYYPIFDNATILQFSKDSLNNSAVLQKALAKTNFNNLFYSEETPYIFQNSEKIVDSNGNQLYATVDGDNNSVTYDYSNLTGSTWVHNTFLVFHKENYKKKTYKNYSSVMNGKPFYYNKDDAKVIYSSAKGIVKDLYTQVVTATEDAVVQADKLDDKLTYYDSNLNRAYTTQQYQDLASQLNIYILNSDTYETYIVLNSGESTTINIPIIYNHTIDSQSNKVSNDGESSLELTLYDNSGEIQFKNVDNNEGSSKLIAASYKNNSYSSVISVEYSKKEQIKNLGKLTNGEFWYNYHNTTDSMQQPLLEYAAVIETQLESYWQTAYKASKGCDYFLPQYWQPTITSDVNFFSKEIISEDENGNPFLVNTYLPVIQKVSIGSNTQLPQYNWTFNTKITPVVKTEVQKSIVDYDIVGNQTKTAISENLAISEFMDNISFLWSDTDAPENHWMLEPLEGITKTYYIATSGGCTWRQLIKKLTEGKYDPADYSGTYPMLLRKWGQRYSIDELLNYNELLTKHNNLWEKIYQEYPNIILEENYSNSDAASSNDLIKGAQYYLKQYYQPETQYNITTINSADLTGPGFVPKIGQGIEINPSYYQSVSSKIFSDALKQYLFVTDISYTLRNDSDIKLTVNSVKYSDKLIQRLATLIR